MARLRNYFLTGLIVTGPIAITLYIVWWFVRLVDSWFKPYIPARYSPESYLPFSVPGFGLVVGLVAVTLIGFLTANFAGRSVLGFGERLLGRMPLVRSVYGGLKQIFQTVLANRAELFTRVGLVEFPRRGAWSLVLIGPDREFEITDVLREREGKVLTVFRPLTPNLTTGYLMYVPEKDVIPLSMSVEEAARVLISGGLVIPPRPGESTQPFVPDI